MDKVHIQIGTTYMYVSPYIMLAAISYDQSNIVQLLSNVFGNVLTQDQVVTRITLLTDWFLFHTGDWERKL